MVINHLRPSWDDPPSTFAHIEVPQNGWQTRRRTARRATHLEQTLGSRRRLHGDLTGMWRTQTFYTAGPEVRIRPVQIVLANSVPPHRVKPYILTVVSADHTDRIGSTQAVSLAKLRIYHENPIYNRRVRIGVYSFLSKKY